MILLIMFDLIILSFSYWSLEDNDSKIDGTFVFYEDKDAIVIKGVLWWWFCYLNYWSLPVDSRVEDLMKFLDGWKLEAVLD